MNKKTLNRVSRYAPAGSGPCVKQSVMATIIAVDGSRYIGTNHCMRPQATCPRASMPTGVGYELCKEVCQQEGHAEVNAVRIAGEKTRGATLYLEGHTYACDNCIATATAAGIDRVVIGAPPHIVGRVA
jgi:deoxycytidylate deaminase